MTKQFMKKHLLHKPISLTCLAELQSRANKIISDEWNFKSEKLIRLPLEGELFDLVNDECVDMGFNSISIWTIFVRAENNQQKIHCDAYSKSERVKFGLVIPVFGTLNSKMQWFDESNMELKSIQNPDNLSSLFILNKITGQPKVLQELEIVEPIIARLDVPHRAVASSASPRAIISIKFIGNPDLLPIKMPV